MTNNPPATSPVDLPPDEFDPRLLIVSIVILGLVNIFSGLRLCARKIGRVLWGWDDTLFVASVLFASALAVTSICTVQYGGMGRHTLRVNYTDPSEIDIWGRLGWVETVLYFISVALPKLSLLALYHRIFGTSMSKKTVWTCWAIAAVVIGNCVANVIVAISQCRPVKEMWTSSDRVNIGTWWRWCSVTNVITDVVVFAIPISHVLRMHTSLKVKFGLAITFATGSVGLGTALWRFVLFFQHEYRDWLVGDPTWVTVPLMMLTVVEPGIYVIAAAQITFKPLFRSVFGRIESESKIRGREQQMSNGNIVVLRKLSGANESKGSSEKWENAQRKIDIGEGHNGYSVAV